MAASLLSHVSGPAQRVGTVRVGEF